MIEASELRRYSLFGGLMQEQIDGIFTLMKHEQYEAGQDLIVVG
jgi:hypothetical protein